MDQDEPLKKFLSNLGVDLKENPGALNAAKEFIAKGQGAQSVDPNFGKQGQSADLPSSSAPSFSPTISQPNKEAINKSIESLLSGKRSDGGRGTFLFDPVTNKLKPNNSSGGSGVHYDMSGKPKETGPGSRDDLRTNRIEGKQGPSERSQELKAQSEGMRSGNVDRIKDNLANGKNAFDGMQSPAQVKAEQMAEGGDDFSASMAAGQQYRDMFGLKGAQGDVLRDAAKEGKAGEIYDALKQGRADNLKNMSQERIASGAKPVGSVQSIEADGRVLAQRTGQEEGVRVASGGLAGAVGGTVDGPGKLELTDAGKNVIANRTLTYTSPAANAQDPKGNSLATENLVGKAAPNAQDSKGTPSSAETNTTVAGRYGTAVGGKLNFPEALTPAQKLGDAPLSEANQKYKDETLAAMRATAVDKGELSTSSKETIGQLAQALPQQVKTEMDKTPISGAKQTNEQILTAASGGKALPSMSDRPVPVPKENSAIIKGLTAPSDSLTGIEKKKKLAS